MYKLNGQLTFSPSDLIRFLESPYASWMDRYYLESPGKLTPDEQSAEEKLVAESGNRHERRYLEQLEAKGSVTRISSDHTAEAEFATLNAIAAGADCIFQACLRRDNFRGFADFLRKTGTDEKGRALYAVWDTKLALQPKPYYLVQLCCYAEMLEPVQGILPDHVGVVLGNGIEHVFITAEFFHYYRQIKAGFLQLMRDFKPGDPPAPLPRANHGRWASHAQRWVEEHDHLVQVAGILTSQIRKLNAAGIHTVAQLAKAKYPAVPKLSDEMLERLSEQARLQVKTRQARAKAPAGAVVPPAYRILQPAPDNPRHGLALLPPHNAGDVFFDMEGYPMVKGGLEYLFGASTRGRGGKPVFHDWWAHDAETEKQAFEGFMDWAHTRWQGHPGMHIYHYANYELAAVRRLAGKHGTREAEADALQRNGVLIDLYKVVRQGLRVGEPSYSIKYIEHLYRGARGGDVATAGESIVYFANWLESGEPPDWRQSPILKKIRDYNQDDCESTVQLCDWLRESQREAKIPYLPPPPKEVDAREPNEAAMQKQQDVGAWLNERARITNVLKERIAHPRDAEAKRLDELFLDLLEFHRREEKPLWWRLFSRMEADVAELKDDLDCIGGAELVIEPPVQVKRSKIFTYRFDPGQDTKIRTGDRVYARPSTAATMAVEKLDENGLIQVKIGDRSMERAFPDGMPVVTSFLPAEVVSAAGIRGAIETVVTGWADSNEAPTALLRFLRREPPRLPDGVQLRQPGEEVSDAAVRCVQVMQESALCLQGPPGSGKTTTAARMIATLLEQGRKVGVLSNSHKAIENLLGAVCSLDGVKTKVHCVGGDGELKKRFPRVIPIAQTAEADAQYEDGLIGGTAWLFCRPEWVGRLDYLFVDEAGQVSLANLVGVARCAANLLLMGDQMQLEQPVQGQHPGESGQSALIYYLQEHQTIPAHLGLFLNVTHRLEPEVCRFVSDLIYEGRLQPAPGNRLRRLVPAGAKCFLPKESGLEFLPVQHEGNVQASDEEADIIRKLIKDLIGRVKIDDKGKPAGWVELEDILIVAPYNLQVRRLKAALPKAARIGSVDKFQGQEAEVVIVSMCSSFGEYGSRGLEFLLDQNRLNVALTRARTLAVVVGDSRIAASTAGTIPSMRRLNLYCRLVQDHSVLLL